MVKELVLTINKEDIEKIVEYKSKIETDIYIIDYLFSAEKDNEDSDIVKSSLFKKFHKNLVEINKQYIIERALYEEKVLKPFVESKTGMKNIHFKWDLDVFFNKIKIDIME